MSVDPVSKMYVEVVPTTCSPLTIALPELAHALASAGAFPAEEEEAYCSSSAGR